ncbi:putative Serine/Threonine-kinase [Thalictrum thalictroides]|uniref:Putative Serine/Threonine-kinase n=1 Tax=Thalictrum thalictroides TaxID=46969 RepID=A0A7J6XD16_THATH|nr:putative Serine/Threonine-kinase [Thalictrum thalictroides]
MMDIGEVVKNNHLGRESLCKAETSSTPSSDFGLQWGNRKRLRCMKIQVKSDSTNTDKTKARINRGVVKHTTIKDSTTTTNNNNNSNFRRPVSPPPPAHRISRNSEAMKGQSNGGVKAGNISPDRVVGEEKDHHKKGNNNNNNNNNGVVVGGGGASGSSETAQDSKKGGSSSGSGEAIPVWLPKFVIALTNKEKEEDFMAIKGSKLPQRPKKRAKFVQRTLNKKKISITKGSQCLKGPIQSSNYSSSSTIEKEKPEAHTINTTTRSSIRSRAGNSEAMKGQSNGGVKAGNISPDRVVGEEKDHHKKGNNNNNNNNNGVVVGGGGASGSSETAQDSKKGGSSSGSGEAIPVWLPKFVIALTNKEKEEDFMAIKGSKLPQRPKKRAKFVQRTLNLVSPGAWLCDLTLERYEVREKKISKKRPRGLKAMGNMDSDSD